MKENIKKGDGNMINTATKQINNNTERYCSIEESLKESFNEVKLYKEGKIKLKTWDEYLKNKRK